MALHPQQIWGDSGDLQRDQLWVHPLHIHHATLGGLLSNQRPLWGFYRLEEGGYNPKWGGSQLGGRLLGEKGGLGQLGGVHGLGVSEPQAGFRASSGAVMG